MYSRRSDNQAVGQGGRVPRRVVVDAPTLNNRFVLLAGLIATLLVRMDVYLDGAAFILGCLTVANMHP